MRIAVYTETVLNLARPDTVTERVTVAYAGPELFDVEYSCSREPSTASFANRLDYSAVARLRPGVSPAMAAADLERILPAIEGVYTDATAARIAEVQLAPIVVPLNDYRLKGGRFRPGTWD